MSAVNPFDGVNADAMEIIGTLLGKVYQQGDDWEHPACDIWLKQWRAARGDAALGHWQWWIGEVDGESFALPFDTRAKAIAAAPQAIAQGDFYSEDGAYAIVEARCWNDEVTAGDDIIWFAEQRNQETLRVPS